MKINASNQRVLITTFLCGVFGVVLVTMTLGILGLMMSFIAFAGWIILAAQYMNITEAKDEKG